MEGDLAVKVFGVLHAAFFDAQGKPIPFFLREKANTQSDPLDEHISELITGAIKGVECFKAGSITSPDLAILDSSVLQGTWKESDLQDLNKALAIEVKKVERGRNGVVARATGMDYNSTPPSSHVYLYDKNDRAFMVRCFYLFVSTEAAADKKNTIVTALTLCDGAALNTDVDLYKQIVAPRDKQTDVGSYGEGAIRNRPMLIFPNPLGVDWLDRTPSLIHPAPDLERVDGRLRRICTIKRTLAGTDGKEFNTFYCYQDSDLSTYKGAAEVTDPFPTPKERQQGRRGKFRVPVEIQ
ncbi:hypothetical protein J2Z79_001117 [Symbiobacterium terraclitae]|uniref:Restriction endonuclease n=1 Tax=Symbiobacterium terraclitae TaxID=557451 RepID=A0ABS4JQB3_9FIRM|nr:hypothetical protein [Symbiobacterium terraclitae]MBP2017732.1 hypothetical protein [Symbiobacterium terraclitae]